jgi:hypothetical protein
MGDHGTMRSIGLAVLLLLASCEYLDEIPSGTLPRVEHKESSLVQSPSQTMMEAYYCPDVVPDPGGIPGAADLLCEGFFGSPPSPQSMEVAFRLDFQIQNPNGYPVPMSEMLTAVTVFPADTGGRRLGAVCVAFCPPGSTTCTGAPGPQSCMDSDSDIKSIDDLQNVTESFLVSSGVQALAGQTPTFTAPEVAAGATLPLSVIFKFGPEPLLETLRQLALQSADQLAAGEDVTFAIPFELEGTVWFDAGSAGRVAVRYGPVAGTFVVPTERLVSSVPLP